ncbi:putative transcription factor interactor and regulator CCHC(Zn) family [Helianthus anomalus]
MKRKGDGVFHRKDTRTCFKCNEVGHIASGCSQMTKPKQGVSEKLKEKVVDVEPPIENFKTFENSISEVGECSMKFFYKKKAKDNQVWVLKKGDEKVGNETDSTKSVEPQAEFEKIKQKVGKVEISNQFFSDQKEFDIEKAFNGNVKKIFGKMVERKAKGVKDFYATKKANYNPTEQELKTPKVGQTWVEILFP